MPDDSRFVNENDRVIPPQDGERKTSKSKFALDDNTPRQLTSKEINKELGTFELDEEQARIRKAWLFGNEVKIELANGQTFTCGRDSDGRAYIDAPKTGPVDATSMIAMAEIARAKGWPSVTVNGKGEEFRALSCLAIEHAGLKMNDAPERAVVEKYRERFETALATGVDPVAEARREQAAEADKPAAPSGKSPDTEPEKQKRPAVKVGAPAMK